MAILNYTTSIEAEKTVAEIQAILAKSGAQAILSEYDADGILCALSFRLVMAAGPVNFKLPANFDGVYRCLQKEKKVPYRLKTKAQASRVAWRIMKDWIEAQLAIVQAQCADMAEVFLPYAQGQDGRTVYEAIRGNGFLQLTGPKK